MCYFPRFFPTDAQVGNVFIAGVPIAAALLLLAGCDPSPQSPTTTDRIEDTGDWRYTKGTAGREPLRTDSRTPISASGDGNFRELYRAAIRDFGQCAATVKQDVEPSKRDSVLLRLALEVCFVDLANYERAVAHITRAEDRQTIAESIIAAWTKRDPGRLLNFADQVLPPAMKNTAYRRVVRLLCDRGDRDVATRVLERMPLSLERSSVLREIANSWKPDEFRETLRWAAGIQRREDRLTVIEKLTDDAVRGERTDALEELARVSENPADRGRIATRVATLKLQNEGSAAATAWLTSLPQVQRTAPTLAIIAAMSGTDPETATQMALSLTGGRDRKTALSLVLGSALQEDPENAARWVFSLPAGWEQTEMIRRLTDGWYNTDSIALSDWINRIERGPLRGEAIVTLAKQLLRSDRAAALRVAQAIQDEKRRNSFLNAHNKP